MDQSITLRNKTTEQECVFTDQDQVDNFGANVENRDDWELVAAEAPADVAPQGLVVAVDLGELRASLAEEAAADPAPAPAEEPASAKPAKKLK